MYYNYIYFINRMAKKEVLGKEICICKKLGDRKQKVNIKRF